MRPVNSASPSTPTPVSSGVSIWKSPVPYLFGGLAFVLALISVALVVLICSYTKRASHSSSSSSPQEQEEEGDFKLQVMTNTDSEPRILVVMAGDDKPTHLAKPIVPLSYCTCEPEPTPSSSTSISSEQKSH